LRLSPVPSIAPEKMKLTRFHICLLTVGASSVATQLVVVREFMSTFGGNELVVGVALGIWLLAGGLGSKIAVRLARSTDSPLRRLFAGHLILAVLPLMQIAAIRALPLLWVRGQMLGLSSSTVFGAIIILPYVLVSGAMIPLAVRLDQNGGAAARAYVTDTVGDILGGLVFSLILVHFFSHWQTLAFFGLLHALAAAILGRKDRPLLSCALSACIAAIIAFSFLLAPASRSWRLPGQEIITWKNSPFCQLAITRTGDQYNVWQDGILLFSSDEASVEALVHPAMCQVRKGASVLVVAGGVFGSIEEIAKHAPSGIDYVELDKSILNLDSVLFRSLERPEVGAHVGDGRLFIKQSKRRYDVIIIDLPDPENAQINRFYTQDFFNEAKRALNPEGVLYFSLAGADNYLEKGGLALNRTVFQALEKTFAHVLAFPGITHYFLASESPLDLDVSGVLAARSISTRQLVDIDLATMTDPFRMDNLADLLNEEAVKPNRDLSPWAFGHMLDLWMTKSKSSQWLFWGVIMLVLSLAAMAGCKDRIRFAIMTSGFAGMGVELALVLLFQVVYGYAYTILCLFITLFMAGAAAGGYLSLRPEKNAVKRFIRGETGLMAAALLALACGPVCVHAAQGWVLSLMGYLVLPLLIAASGWFVGGQFAAASRLCSGHEAQITANLYWADLAGAAGGALVMGLVLLPKLGIQGVLICLLLVKFLSWLVNRNFSSSMT
jgi:spermidine synthase